METRGKRRKREKEEANVVGRELIRRVREEWKRGNYEETTRLIEEAAEKDTSGRGLYLLANCHKKKILGFKKDKSRMWDLLEKAAQCGNGWAMFQLGARNDKHRSWMLRALGTNDNYTKGAYYLGRWGSGSSDTRKGFLYLQTAAAENDNPFAQHELADCYYYGVGVAADYHKALEWYTKSADQGFPWSQARLGKLLMADPTKVWQAWEWARKTAAQNYCNFLLDDPLFEDFQQIHDSRQSILCLIAIHKHKLSNYVSFLQIPRDIVKNIAQYLHKCNTAPCFKTNKFFIITYLFFFCNEGFIGLCCVVVVVVECGCW